MVLIYFYLNCLYFHFTPWRCHEGISFISANKEFSMVCLNRAVRGSAIVGFHYCNLLLGGDTKGFHLSVQTKNFRWFV